MTADLLLSWSRRLRQGLAQPERPPNRLLLGKRTNNTKQQHPALSGGEISNGGGQGKYDQLACAIC